MRQITHGGTESSLARRALLAAALSTTIIDPMRRASAAAPPEITSRARLAIVIGEAAPRYITIGLYGEEAPATVRSFEALCSKGQLAGARDITYTGSIVSKIVRGAYIVAGTPSAGAARSVDRSIDRTGYVRSVMVNKAEELLANRDANLLSHDRAGLLSAPRGGGSYEFWLTPGANTGLDRERIVFGEVLDGMDVIATLDALPTRLPSASRELSGFAAYLGLKAGVGLGTFGLIGRAPGAGSWGSSVAVTATRGVLALGAAALVGGDDPRVRSRELDDRPLTKVRILTATVL